MKFISQRVRVPKRRAIKQRFDSHGRCVERMKPFLLLFKLLGLFANDITGGRLKRCSRPFYGICVFWVSMYILYPCFLLYFYTRVEKDKVRMLIDFVKHVIGFISLSVDGITAYSSQNLFGKFFDRLDSYDYEVARIKNGRRDSLWIPWIAALLTIVSILLLMSVMLYDISMTLAFFATIADMGTMIIHTCGTLEKFLMLHLILMRFKHLNNKIAPNVLWDEKRPPRHGKQRESKMPVKFLEVKILYLMLYDAHKAFNDIYSDSMLLWFASLMIHVLGNVRIFRIRSPLASSAFVGPSIIQLLILCAICHYITEEAKKVPCVLNKSMITLVNSGKTMAKIDTLTYFLHIRVSFKAAGFFTIDLPLFFSIIATITTYFLILV